MTSSETAILVVGDGTTGLTLACDLARHGAAARIVDTLRIQRMLGYSMLGHMGTVDGRNPIRLVETESGRGL